MNIHTQNLFFGSAHLETHEASCRHRVFFRSRSPKRLANWYQKHLGIQVKDGLSVFAWRGLTDPRRRGHTVWAIFPERTDYFGEKTQGFMINYRVKNLSKTIEKLREEGVRVDEKIQETSYGSFGWAVDVEGNRIELWEPPRNYRAPEGQFPSE